MVVLELPLQPVCFGVGSRAFGTRLSVSLASFRLLDRLKSDSIRRTCKP